MTLPILITDRFTPERGFRVTVQTPEQSAEAIMAQVQNHAALRYGDYDSVTFKTALGVQQFRSLGTGRNSATDTVVAVPCAEISFFLGDDEALVARVIEAIYCAHPYEEPVVCIVPCLRTLHIRGMDEGNPNRFWNAAPAD